MQWGHSKKRSNPLPTVAPYGTLSFKLETDPDGRQWVSVLMDRVPQLRFELDHLSRAVDFSVDLEDLHHIKAHLAVMDEGDSGPSFSFELREYAKAN